MKQKFMLKKAIQVILSQNKSDVEKAEEIVEMLEGLEKENQDSQVMKINGWSFYRNSTTGKMVAYYPNTEQLEFDTDEAFEKWLKVEATQ